MGERKRRGRVLGVGRKDLVLLLGFRRSLGGEKIRRREEEEEREDENMTSGQWQGKFVRKFTQPFICR